MKKSPLFLCFAAVLVAPAFLAILPKERSAPVTVKTASHYSSQTGLAKVVALAEDFKTTLSAGQVTTMQLPYAKSSAIRWSNFPQAFSHPNRVGLSLKGLNEQQLAAFRKLMSAVLDTETPNEGLNELDGIRLADNYIAKQNGNTATFGDGNYYIAFLGTPSTDGLWELQFGGHHYGFANTYNKGKIAGVTPSFRGVEPITKLENNGKTYQPMQQETDAFAEVLGSLSPEQRTAALLTGTYSDILLGPGRDGQFPEKSQGVSVGSLTKKQQQLILQAIKTYVGDLDPETAKPYLDKYIAQLSQTYVSFSGSGTMGKENDYIRLDGPELWIEYSVQPGRDFPGTTHPHSVWRDKKTDYGGQ